MLSILPQDSRKGSLPHTYLSLFLQGIGQVAVRVGEVGLEVDRAPVSVDSQIDEAEAFKCC